MTQPFVPADFGHATFGCKVASQDHQTACRFERFLQGRDDFLARSLLGAFGFRTDRQSCHCTRFRMNVLSPKQAASQQAHASGPVHIGGNKSPGGFQVSQERRALADFLEIVNIEWDARLASNRQKM